MHNILIKVIKEVSHIKTHGAQSNPYNQYRVSINGGDTVCIGPDREATIRNAMRYFLADNVEMISNAVANGSVVQFELDEKTHGVQSDT